MNNKTKVIIIDDEKLAQDIIKNYLSEEEVEICAVCNNGFEGIKAINEYNPDLIFLDIQMPKINGFEMLELIDLPPKIIFSTAFDQYAIKAFEINAVDYLLKPFSKDRFLEAFNRAVKLINTSDGSGNEIKELLSTLENSEEKLNRIVIKADSKITVVPIEKIHYIEAQDDYVRIVTDGGKFLKKKTMKFYETHLDENKFIRVHRSYIVNVDLLKQVDLMGKESYQLTLTTNEVLPVSKSGYSNLKNLIGSL